MMEFLKMCMQGLVSGPGEACERHDPCQHGGFCISTDSGPVCDCKHIDFDGSQCERGMINYLNTHLLLFPQNFSVAMDIFLPLAFSLQSISYFKEKHFFYKRKRVRQSLK
jgi:hypothetical protein